VETGLEGERMTSPAAVFLSSLFGCFLLPSRLLSSPPPYHDRGRQQEIKVLEEAQPVLHVGLMRLLGLKSGGGRAEEGRRKN
jgi:hypothetical protein